MHSVAEASSIILAHIGRLGTERVPIGECLGRVLAEDVVARVSMPPWDNSSMDGYAVQSGSIATASKATPVSLKVTGDIPAGAVSPRPLEPGTAMRIMTGAPIPSGADCVVRLEDTETHSDSVSIRAAAVPGRNVRYAGEDFFRGSVVLEEGTSLQPAHVGVLASLGVGEVSVYRAARVAIVSSGDELVTVDQYAEVEAGRKIVSSNNYTLAAAVKDAGGIPVDLGIAGDSVESLRELLEKARDCDLIITTAGVSVGDKDFTRDVIAELGGELIFWRVRMRPGAPLAFGRLFGKPWIGMSGNPVSALVSFVLFAKPAIRKLIGHRQLFPKTFKTRMEEEITTSAPLTHFLRGFVSSGSDGETSARLSGSQSSGVMTALARANALLVIPEDVQRVPVGGVVTAIPLNAEIFASETLSL